MSSEPQRSSARRSKASQPASPQIKLLKRRLLIAKAERVDTTQPSPPHRPQSIQRDCETLPAREWQTVGNATLRPGNLLNSQEKAVEALGIESARKSTVYGVGATIEQVKSPSSVQTSEAKCLISGRVSDSKAILANRVDQTIRVELVAALTTAIAKATASGDVGLARIAMEALQRIFAEQDVSSFGKQ